MLYTITALATGPNTREDNSGMIIAQFANICFSAYHADEYSVLVIVCHLKSIVNELLSEVIRIFAVVTEIRPLLCCSFYCKLKYFSNLTIIAKITTRRKRYIIDSSLCYIPARRRLLALLLKILLI